MAKNKKKKAAYTTENIQKSSNKQGINDTKDKNGKTAKNGKKDRSYQVKQVKEAPEVKKYARFCAALSITNMLGCMALGAVLPEVQSWHNVLLMIVITLEFFILNKNVNKSLQPRRVSDTENILKEFAWRGINRKAAFKRMIAINFCVRLIPYAIVLFSVFCF